LLLLLKDTITANPTSSSAIAISGTGAGSLAALIVAKELEVEPIIIVDIFASKLEVAKTLGAIYIIDSTERDIGSPIRELKPLGVDQRGQHQHRQHRMLASASASASRRQYYSISVVVIASRRCRFSIASV
jgi:Zn-dependent alcohol dehydrogenase